MKQENKQIIPLAIFTLSFAVGMCWFCWNVSNTLCEPNRPEIPSSIDLQNQANKEMYYDDLERDNSRLSDLILNYFGEINHKRNLTNEEELIIKRVDDIINPRDGYYDRNGYYHMPSTHTNLRNFK